MKDATVEIIAEVKPHENADRLDLVKILGYQCVTQKGLYKGGEKIVYIRPDSILPEQAWAEEYRKYAPKRIRAIKLRDAWSEGCIIPLDILPIDLSNATIGEDVSEKIGVIHYDPPMVQDLDAKGNLPFGIPKTDEERFENLVDILPFGETVDLTLKVDGQSCSFYYNVETKEFGVLGRAFEYKESSMNNYTTHVQKYDIKNKLTAFCERENVSLVLRGESYGQGIQSNKYNPHSKESKGWKMFAVYVLSKREYARKGSKYYFLDLAHEINLPTVDVIEKDSILTNELIEKYSTGLKDLNEKAFEGVVVQYARGSFKIINKYYDSLK